MFSSEGSGCRNAIYLSFQGHLGEKRPGHVAMIASEISSLGITSQPQLTQGHLSLLLGCPRRNAFWGYGAAGMGALSQEESMTRGRGP